MKEPALPSNEIERLHELYELCLLDTPDEERFDRITRLTKEYFGVEMALMSLVDVERQWFKSRQGLEARETARKISFCGHAICDDSPLVVENALEDERFKDNPLVLGEPKIRFYAGVPIRGPRGRPIGTLCIIDSKQREFDESALKELNDFALILEKECRQAHSNALLKIIQEDEIKLRSVIDNVEEGIITTDEKGNIESINKAAEEIFGYHLEELIGRNIALLVEEADCPGHQEIFDFLTSESVSEQHQSGREVLAKTRGGELVPVQVRFSSMNVSGENLFVGFIRNISLKKQKDELQAHIAAIVASTEDAIIGITLNGIITSWNRAAERIFGFSAFEAIHRSVQMLVPPEMQAREQELVGNIKEGVNTESIETKRITKYGKKIDVSITTSPIKDQQGQLIGISQIARDITKKKEALMALESAKLEAEQANVAKSRFVANMSHEIRTPLNAIIGFVHLIGKTALSGNQRTYLEMIESSGESLLGTVNDILDFSKIDSGQIVANYKEFPLDDLLRPLANMMVVHKANKNIDLIIDVSPQVPENILGDYAHLHQCLGHLISNALKFTEVGEVLLSVNLESLDDKSRILKFTVKDTGIGLSEEQEKDLFDAFTQADTSFTRHYGGTGLGLAICKKLMDLLGGSIELKSHLHRGTCVDLKVPLRRTEAEAETRAAASGLTRKILIIDDNTTSRSAIGRMIESLSWQSREASGLAEAIEVLEDTAGGQEKPFQLILMDPSIEGTQGKSALKFLHKHELAGKLPLAIMTDDLSDKGLAELDRFFDAALVLTKPLIKSDFLKSVNDFLGDSGEEEAEKDDSLRFQGKEFLLVEDNTFNQVVATGLLQDFGASVVSVNNGQEAIDMLKGSPQRFDMVLMDIQMPVMDGFTATRIIREEISTSLPVLAMTAGVSHEEKESCYENGMNGFIAKPIKLEDMLETISLTFAGTRMEGQNQNDSTTEELETLQEEESAGSGDAEIFCPEKIFSQESSSDFKKTMLRLVRGVVDKAMQPMDEVERVFKDGNVEETAKLLHTLRGSIGSLGAACFSETVLKLEMSLKSGLKEKQLRELFTKARKDFSDFLKQAELWLNSQETEEERELEQSNVVVIDADKLQSLSELLAQRNIRALDVYAEYKPGLSRILDQEQMTNLDLSIERLEFSKAKSLLDKVSFTPVI